MRQQDESDQVERAPQASFSETEESPDEEPQCTFAGTDLRADDPELLSWLDTNCRKILFDLNIHPSRFSWEDLRQVVFTKYWPTLAQYRGEADVKTLIYRIAHNEVVNFCRSKKILPTNAEASKDDREDDFDRGTDDISDHPVVDEDTKILLHELFGHLTPKEQQLCIDVYELGKTPTEIAVERGISHQAVSKQRNNLVKKLRLPLESSSPPKAQTTREGQM